MEKQRVEVFRQALLSRKRELAQLTQDSRESADTVVLDQSKVGRLSRIDALQGQKMAQEVAQRRRLQLQQIDGALQRLASGDYGVCFTCGEDIEPARLDFNPASTRCMACMED
jgi:DnaK suppressor protein